MLYTSGLFAGKTSHGQKIKSFTEIYSSFVVDEAISNVSAGRNNFITLANLKTYVWSFPLISSNLESKRQTKGLFTLFLDNQIKCSPGEINNSKSKTSIHQTKTEVLILKDGLMDTYLQKIEDNSITPYSYNILPEHKIVKISAGNLHVMALSSEGYLFSWGNSSNGRLGQGKCLDMYTPKIIYHLLNYITLDVECGYSHTAVIAIERKSSINIQDNSHEFSNRVFVWGNGMSGALGNGDSTTDIYEPLNLEFFNNKHVKQVACGENFTMALLHDGNIYSFGSNTYGQLGIDNELTTYKATPQLVQISFSDHTEKITSISCFTHCIGVTNLNSLYGWGSNFHGELGINCISQRQNKPLKIDTGLKYPPQFVNSSKKFEVFLGRNASFLIFIAKSSASEPKIAHMQASYSTSSLHSSTSYTSNKSITALLGSESGMATNLIQDSKISLSSGLDQQYSSIQPESASKLNLIASNKMKERSPRIKKIFGEERKLINIEELLPKNFEPSSYSNAPSLSSSVLLETPPYPSVNTTAIVKEKNVPSMIEDLDELKKVKDTGEILKNTKSIEVESKKEIKEEKKKIENKDKPSPIKNVLKNFFDSKKEEKLTKKWLKSIFPNWISYNRTEELKDCIKSGVPLAVRGKLWCHLLGNKLSLTKKYYSILLTKVEEIKNQKIYNSSFESINLDIPRTFADMKFFQEEIMATKLRNLLQVFSVYRQDVGYVQGMNYIAAILLLYMDEYPAFVCLANIICDPFLFGFFSFEEATISSRIKMYKLILEKNLPELLAHFENENISPTTYLIEWFLTLFSTMFDPNTLSVLWDYIFYYGLHFVLKMSVVILGMNAKALQKLELVQLMKHLKDSMKSSSVSPEKIIKKCKDIDIPDWIRIELSKTISNSSLGFE